MHLICLRETWSPLGEIKLLTWDSTTKLTRSNTAADHDVKSTTDDRGKIQRAPSTGVSPHIILPTINTYLHMITCFRIHTKRPKALSLSGFFDQHTKILFFTFLRCIEHQVVQVHIERLFVVISHVSTLYINAHTIEELNGIISFPFSYFVA